MVWRVSGPSAYPPLGGFFLHFFAARTKGSLLRISSETPVHESRALHLAQNP